MNAKTFHLSVQGASHIKKNKECQDYSSSYQDNKCAVVVVCDGHGGDDYVRSAVGSKLGCEVAENMMVDFMNSIDKEFFFLDPEKHIKSIEASIINGWNEAITDHYGENPFLEDELSGVSEKARKKYVDEGRIESAYGTTLIAVAMNDSFWFGIHIGDGKCVAINPEGEFKQPIPWDPKCFLNATTSICDSDAIERFRHFYSEKLPAAVFIGSDGIDDCFKNNEQLHNLYKTVLFSFATTDFEEAYEGLKDYLPRLSAKGSGDDVSVAALLDMDLIPDLAIVREFDREKEKARIEENARKEAERNEAEKRRVEEEHARFQQKNNASLKKQEKGHAPKFCENCGERIKPGVKFCSNCGNKIDYDKDSSALPDDKDQKTVRVIEIPPFFTEPDAESTQQQDYKSSRDEGDSRLETNEDLTVEIESMTSAEESETKLLLSETAPAHEEDTQIESCDLDEQEATNPERDTMESQEEGLFDSVKDENVATDSNEESRLCEELLSQSYEHDGETSEESTDEDVNDETVE